VYKEFVLNIALELFVFMHIDIPANLVSNIVDKDDIAKQCRHQRGCKGGTPHPLFILPLPYQSAVYQLVVADGRRLGEVLVVDSVVLSPLVPAPIHLVSLSTVCTLADYVCP
jgi:hypothetical protein